MVSWFVRGVRRGVVTTRYPASLPEEWARDLPTPPLFAAESITEDIADALVDACPSGALRHRGPWLRYDVGACTTCGRCLDAGRGAVVPSGQFELAATDRDQLVKDIPIRGGQP